jgi:hypothetical protein
MFWKVTILCVCVSKDVVVKQGMMGHVEKVVMYRVDGK